MSSDSDGTPIGQLSAAMSTLWQCLIRLHSSVDRLITRTGRDLLALPDFTPGAGLVGLSGQFGLSGDPDVPAHDDDLFGDDGRPGSRIDEHAGPVAELIGHRRALEAFIGTVGALRLNVDALRGAGDHATARGHINLVTTQLHEMRELQGLDLVIAVDVHSGVGERPDSWWQDLEELQREVVQADVQRAAALAKALDVQAAIEGT